MAGHLRRRVTTGCAAAGAVFVVALASAPGTAQRAPQGAGACTNPANKVVAENCKPGNPSTEWDINGSGDPRIQGFATDISVNIGDAIAFKIGSDSPRYRIDIYRLGYYGGAGAQTRRNHAPLSAAPADTARVSARRERAPLRLRQLGGVGLLGGPARRDVRHLHRAPRARG